MKRALIVILCALASYSLPAQTITVTTPADSGPGSLRQAIAEVVTGGTIVFDASLSSDTITLTSGELAITDDLTITGPGADRLSISGNNTSRVFHISAGATVAIHGLTIEDGNTSGDSEPDGGAILNLGDLTLSHCVIRNSRAGDGPDDQTSAFVGQGGLGGGIATRSSGTLTIQYSTVTGNRAGDGGDSAIEAGHGGQGGGIYTEGSMLMERCTVSFNQAGNAGTGSPSSPARAGDAGGLFAFFSTIRNSTISNNSSGTSGSSVGFAGGALLRGGTVANTTITANSLGGGLATFPFFTEPITVSNTIVAGNSYWQCVDQVGGIIQSAGHNISTTGGDCAFSEPSDTNIDGSDVFTSLLSSTLQDNGGPTETHALLTGSAAVDQGSCPDESSDQRVFGATTSGPRAVDQAVANVDDGCDVGAFELGAAPLDLVVHLKRPDGWGYPHVHYFATTPDIGDTSWPGEPMVQEGLGEGCGWYQYRFPGAGMAHIVFNGNTSPQTADLFRSSEGWYDGTTDTWTEERPEPLCPDVVRISARAFLQGPYLGPLLMSRALQLSDNLPSEQPYGGAGFTGPARHNGEESSEELGSGGSLPATDWSIVELRTGMGPETKVAARAGIHLYTGDIVDPVSLGSIDFWGVSPGLYYVVVRHRNHLPVMSSTALLLESEETFFDFTDESWKAHGTNPMVQMPDGKWAMWAADANGDGVIGPTDLDSLLTATTTSATGYELADFNMDSSAQALDLNLYATSRAAQASSQVPE